MSEQISDQATTVPAQSVPVLPTDFNIHSDALTTLKSEGEALVSAIKNNAEMTAKELAAIQEVTVAAQKLLESGKATIADINSLFTATQATNNQATEIKTQATAALESIRSLVNTATDAGGRLEVIKTQAEARRGLSLRNRSISRRGASM